MDQQDLTASHWDDVFSASSSRPFASVPVPLENGFQEFNKFNDEDKDGEENEHQREEEEEEEQDDDEEVEEGQNNLNSNLADLNINFADLNINKPSYGWNEAEAAQLAELSKEERKEHRSNLISELTDGVADIDSVIAPSSPARPIAQSESLFKETTSPIKIKEVVSSTGTQNNNTSTNTTDLGKSKLFTRSRRYNPKTVVENLSVNPLGPLGGSDTTLENETSKNVRESLVQEVESPLYKIPSAAAKAAEDVAKFSQPIISKPRNGTQSDVDDDSGNSPQASNNLEITVGDPMKVGDITNAHIVYSITVKHKDDPSSNKEPVIRRYRDFRWIYHQLQNNHPGIIIPPPPTKQTYIGRFNENFIENRRLSLEKMLTKISNLDNLRHDSDFEMFLTSNNFIDESKERERLSGSEASVKNDDTLDSNSELSSSIIDTSTSGGGAGGFMSSLFSISNKVNEPNDFLKEKKIYIENLELNLRNFYKSLELIGIQRSEIILLVEEISNLSEELSSLEILKRTTDLLGEFSEVHIKLKDNLDRTNLQDQLTLGFTIEEYLRIIGSIKSVFQTRLKIYTKFQNCEQELNKKQIQFEKFCRKNLSQTDKINLLKFEIEKLEAKTVKFKHQFTTITDTFKEELERFEFEKIDDFRNSVEIFIESSIESQKESIELWETFYERQNLADI